MAFLLYQDLLKEREFWYSQPVVLNEIVSCLQHRELSFLHPVDRWKSQRFYLAMSVEYLKKHFARLEIFKDIHNLYISVAKFKPNSIPIFSYNLKERMNDPRYIDFNKNYPQYVEGYDLFIDIDGKDKDMPKLAYEQALAEMKKMKKLFDDFKLPYWLINSSKTGFHFHIPCEYLSFIRPQNLLVHNAEIIKFLNETESFERLDLSISDTKRLCKVPYSYVSDGSICLPLSDEMAENFNPEIANVHYIWQPKNQITLKNRGLLIRNHGLSENELKQNVIKFYETHSNFKIKSKKEKEKK